MVVASVANASDIDYGIAANFAAHDNAIELDFMLQSLGIHDSSRTLYETGERRLRAALCARRDPCQRSPVPEDMKSF